MKSLMNFNIQCNSSQFHRLRMRVVPSKSRIWWEPAYLKILRKRSFILALRKGVDVKLRTVSQALKTEWGNISIMNEIVIEKSEKLFLVLFSKQGFDYSRTSPIFYCILKVPNGEIRKFVEKAYHAFEPTTIFFCKKIFLF